MSENWKRWEGRTADGKFPLQTYLGGSDHSAVFLTRTENAEKAAVKLISADPANFSGEEQLLRWKASASVSHPNLIRILAMGRCQLDSTRLLYVVMEYAEENLAQILPERALTAEEVRGMLLPLLGALQSVHDRGYAHGSIRPSNILAIGDQVKLSSDSLTRLGDKTPGANAPSIYDPPEAPAGAASTAGDSWQTGVMLVEVLTQKLPAWERSNRAAPEIPAGVPDPFREIAARCLQLDPAKRWTIAQIAQIGDRLEMKQPKLTPVEHGDSPAATVSGSSAPDRREVSSRPKVSAKWGYLVVVAVVAAIVFVFIPKPKTSAPASQSNAETNSQGISAERSAPPAEGADSEPSQAQSAKTSAGQEVTSPAAATTGSSVPKAAADESGVVEQVIPQVSPGARHTIQGKIKVRVKVEVDAAGNVEKAKLDSGSRSKYFSRVALEAAKEWKFVPAPGGANGLREWKLLFSFSRAKTEASAERGKR
jgi:eukaryotic-like serine/threonine-protein kinase